MKRLGGNQVMRKIITLFFICLLGICFWGIADADPMLSLVEAARTQIGKTVVYDPGYRAIDYPGGDIPFDRGVCTDVVIRAARQALNIDLQQLVHEDMKQNFSEYPDNWGLKLPDKNIDHRRVPNLETFFTRQDWSLPVSDDKADYRAGDIVTCTVPPHLPHIMIVSDTKNACGVLRVIHNIGAGTREEDRLFEFPLTGHYRISKE
jgi:uncharacterized protein YijF (DUF1287 family)